MNPLNNIVSVLIQHNEKQTAYQLLNTLAKYATTVSEYDILGNCFCDIKKYENALFWAMKICAETTDSSILYNTRGNIAKLYNFLNFPEKSLDIIKENQKNNPNDYDSYLEEAFSLYLLNEKQKSKDVLLWLLEQPNLPQRITNTISFNLSTHLMYTDRYLTGLSDFIKYGKKMNMWLQHSFSKQEWDGIVVPGTPLIIHAMGKSGGGIGDEIINVRFCKYVESLGMIPIWVTSRTFLHPIFERCGVRCVSKTEEAPKNSAWIHSMSLPIALNLSLIQLKETEYLTVDTEYDTKWKKIISGSKKKIGLRWAGNQEYDQDLHRTLPINQLYETIYNPNHEYYSLQRDDNVDPVYSLSCVVDLQHTLETYEDVLGALNQLDVFITSCTSLAHASAALGKRTIVLVPITEYYVWIGDHWYGDNVTVLRQSKPRDWEDPIQQLNQLLNIELSYCG